MIDRLHLGRKWIHHKMLTLAHSTLAHSTLAHSFRQMWWCPRLMFLVRSQRRRRNVRPDRTTLQMCCSFPVRFRSSLHGDWESEVFESLDSGVKFLLCWIWVKGNEKVVIWIVKCICSVGSSILRPQIDWRYLGKTGDHKVIESRRYRIPSTQFPRESTVMDEWGELWKRVWCRF